MNYLDILLIIISSAGLLHGLAFAVYLCFFKKKKSITNYLLASILILMALRIGKSVMLYFGNDLEPLFIFMGLAFLLVIGPLIRWYVRGMTQENFGLSRYYLLELVPFLAVFVSSFFVTKNWFDTKDMQVIIVFAGVLIFIYLHLAFYIISAAIIVKKVKKIFIKEQRTKSQRKILAWLTHLIVGFAIIWISYFLNIIEDAVPYIIGPILYSVVVYYLSIKAIQGKVTDIDGAVFKKNDDVSLFHQLSALIEADKLYLDADVSLLNLSKLIHKSPQKTSELINQNARQNFNDFINRYRIDAAKTMLLDHENLTIASIAFDSGFNSLSSFNAAFKKAVGITPSLYRKNNSESI